MLWCIVATTTGSVQASAAALTDIYPKISKFHSIRGAFWDLLQTSLWVASPGRPSTPHSPITDPRTVPNSAHNHLHLSVVLHNTPQVVTERRQGNAGPQWFLSALHQLPLRFGPAPSPTRSGAAARHGPVSSLPLGSICFVGGP